MTGSAVPAPQSADENATRVPSMLLTFAFAGAEVLQDLLARVPLVACTTATGLVPLCHAAATTWQRIEAGGERLSAVAVTSIRAMATAMMAVVTAETGAARWCETAFGAARAAPTYHQVFPQARFVCLYRSCDRVVAEAIAAHPWGLGGTVFWPYAGADPGNSAAAIAAYWADCAESLIEFEEARPGSCLRVRAEDMAADPDGTLHAVCGFLGLHPPGPATPADPPGGEALNTTPLRLPPEKIPPRLRAWVGELHAKLGYPSLAG
jgi:protein-tyrosine sulfotransferase